MMLESRWKGPPAVVPDWSPMKRYQMNMAYQQQTEVDYLAPRLFRAASDWVLKNAHHGEAIFCCVDSFSPHEPFDAPLAYRNRFLDPGQIKKRTPWVEKNVETMARDWPGITVARFTHHHQDSMAWEHRFPPDEHKHDREITWPIYHYTNAYNDRELRYLRASYASLVELTDRWLGYFIDTLKSTRLYDDATIVLISDHGHQLGEHGCIGKMANGQFPNLNDLILLVKLPRQQLGGTRDPRLVSNTEIFPTIMEFKGHPVPKDVDGFPLFTQGDDDFGPWFPTKHQRDIVTCGFTHQVMATDKKWYYMATTERAQERLWDTEATPAMRDDDECGEAHKDVLDKMWNAISAVIAGERVKVVAESSQKWYDMKEL